MTETKIQIENFEKAISKLKDAMKYNVSEIDIALDATIQRFEFTFEMAWKSIKMTLKMIGHNSQSPRESLKLAYKMGWIQDEDQWLRLLEARNLTSHTYDQPTAEDVYETIKENYAIFDKLLQRLKNELDSFNSHH